MIGASMAAFHFARSRCAEAWFQRWVWQEQLGLVFMVCTPTGAVKIPRQSVCYNCEATGVTQHKGNLITYCNCQFGAEAVLRDFGPNDVERIAAAKYFTGKPV